MEYVKGVVPATFDPDATQIYAVGEITVDTAMLDEDGKIAPVLYISLEDPNTRKKKSYMVGGAGKYELIQHLSRAHMIGPTAPQDFDRSTTWYNTEMVFVEQSDVTKSYITIRTEKSPGVWEWRKILPYTSLDTVILGKDDDNNVITLGSIIKNNRVINKLPINVKESARGEIYLNDNDELYFNRGEGAENQHLLGTVSNYLRERIKEMIAVKETQPLNFDYNTVWFTDEGDISLARSKYINFVDPNKSTGLKFTKDNDQKMKSAATLENEAKSVIIDNNSTTNFGHIWLNFPFNENGKYYLELYIEDKENNAQFMFLGDGRQQPLLNDYGTHVDRSSLLITTSENKIGNLTTQKEFIVHKKTVFIEVTKSGNSCAISMGYVTDSGEKVYKYGNATSGEFTMNLARIAVGSSINHTANSYTRFSVRPFLIKKIPEGFTGINNTLPGEQPFSTYVLATNAAGVHTSPTTTLADQVDTESGRLIPVFRDYNDRNNARINEILVDRTTAILYTKRGDGQVVPIAGALDTSITDHIMNSLKVTANDVATFTKIETDPTRIYISTKDSIPAPGNVIEGNMAVIDNSPGQSGDKYKLVLPKSKTTLINHDWKDLVNDTPKNGSVKLYLDELDQAIRNAITKDNVYSGYEELNLKKSDLINTYNTLSSYIQELTKRMNKNSLYMETINELPAGGVSSNPIENFFNVPENGMLYGFADENDNFYAQLVTAKDTYYKTFMRPSYSAGGGWKKKVLEVDGTATVTNLTSTNTISTNLMNTVEGKVSNLTISTNRGNIKINTNNVLGGSLNFLKHKGESLTDNFEVELFENKLDKLSIFSKTRPKWIDSNNNEHQWLLTDDIRNSWNYKGKTYINGNHIDLNTLEADTTNGYYTIPSEATSGNNFPKERIKGILNNYRINGEASLQVIFASDTDGHRIYMRTKDGARYTPWTTVISDKDIKGYLPLSGGVITGDLTVQKNSTLNNLNVDGILKGNILSTAGDRNIARYSIIDSTPSILYGDTRLTRVVISNDGSERPQYYNGTKYQNFVVEDDIAILRNRLRDDYYTKPEINGFLENKVDSNTYTNDMRGKVSKAGDTMIGTLTMTSGDIVLSRGNLDISRESKLQIAGQNFADNLLYSNHDVSKYQNTLTYDAVSLGSSNAMGVFTVSSGKLVSVDSNTPSSIQFSIDKNGSFSVNPIINKTTRGQVRKVLMKDEIVNGYNGGVDKVLSAEKGKELDLSNIGANRGKLSTIVNTSTGTFVESNLIDLKAGYYYITTKNEQQHIGLDISKIISNEGVLVVEGNRGELGRTYKYITKTDESFIYAIRNETNGSGSWKYIYDSEKYFVKEEVNTLLSNLRSVILKKFISTRFNTTGNNKNTSIPRKLVHTHNYDTISGNQSDFLYFKTNITTTRSSENKNFIIELIGYSLDNSADIPLSRPFHIYISGRCEHNGTSAIVRYVNIVRLIPGSRMTASDVTVTPDGFVTFNVSNYFGDTNLSFDTYMRFSNIEDTNFDGEITAVRLSPFI